LPIFKRLANKTYRTFSVMTSGLQDKGSKHRLAINGSEERIQMNSAQGGPKIHKHSHYYGFTAARFLWLRIATNDAPITDHASRDANFILENINSMSATSSKKLTTRINKIVVFLEKNKESKQLDCRFHSLPYIAWYVDEPPITVEDLLPTRAHL